MGFKHNKKFKVNIYKLLGCELDELYENDKLFNFWFNKFINKEIQKRKFKMITGWSFMISVKKKQLIQNSKHCL